MTVSDQLIGRACDALTSKRRQIPIILVVSVRDRRATKALGEGRLRLVDQFESGWTP
jgi:hypothetical protein